MFRAQPPFLRPRCISTRRVVQKAVQAVKAPVGRPRSGAADVTEKAPNDIVTATDVLVQNEIEHILREHEPDIAFVGEEGTPTLVHDASRVWLVDPICGTANYAAALPLFATNIARLEEFDAQSGGVSKL
jgi:myo-inositol-1(or 4)-monophosphatase